MSQRPGPFIPPAHPFGSALPADGKTQLSVEDLSRTVSVSALPWLKGKELLIVPPNVAGLTILDVGGGASDITATLLEMGADAFSIDPRYKKKSEINEMIKFQLQRGGYDMQVRMLINKTLQRFMASINAAPDRYKVASATELPFPDNSCDFVFSIDTVTAFLDVDRDILMKCVAECIRVLKPGGQVQFLPFGDMQPSWQPALNMHRMKNDEHALEWLKNHPQVETVEVTNSPIKFHHRLSFKKKIGA